MPFFRRPDHEHGAAAVEMALILPILVLLLGGIIDFGFAFNAQISLTHAAREGVRVEAIGGTGDPVATAQDAFLAPGVTGSTAQVTQGCGGGGDQARLRITTNYSFFLLPLSDRSLEGQAVMRCGG
jgi:Flp pilus assembly protein TadG